MSEKINTVRGRAWCGLWRDGKLGWMAPKFVSEYPEPLSFEQSQCLNPKDSYGSDFYRVEIIIRPVKDKRGRYIIKRGAKP